MLTIETLRKNATKFAKDFTTASYEMGQAQSFIIELCKVFDLDYIRAVRFEDRVKKAKGKGRIDAFFPGLLLVEMKSAGKDLDEAYSQATDYFHGLKDEDLPRCVLVSDFQNLHLYNQEIKEEPLKIRLAELPQHIERFRFLTGYKKIATERQERINKAAAEKMADLHDAVKDTGYAGKDLETYLVRLLFCLFADSTGLLGENSSFLNYLENYTRQDGSDLHCALTLLFYVLNKPTEQRLKSTPEHLALFPYVNGSLFEGTLADCYFDEFMRNKLLECAKFDWSEISPAIFGTLFQAIMHFDDEQPTAKTKKRREFGAHYTSEENILKVINPLFMDNLRAEFEKIRRSKLKLAAFHNKLAELNFFDPACGCGNFLIIAYRELRLLELEVIKAQWGKARMAQLDVDTLILCNVHQFHGIDIDESAVHIATLAMWLVDHQMNLRVQELGLYYNRIPLVKKANIVCANALQIDWESVISPKQCSFIMGNPPFIGKKEQKTEQKVDLQVLATSIKGAGVLDYVTGWYIKATAYIKKNSKISVAFVSTNSICQGEQVGILWNYLLSQGVKIRFAYRTFRWSNEGRGVAAVHCVIVGFGLTDPERHLIFDDNIIITASNINPYLVDASNLVLSRRNSPLNDVPPMLEGITPLDNGLLSFTKEQYVEFLAKEPTSKKWFKKWLTGESYINSNELYCLWLADISPAELKAMPYVMELIQKVKQFRESSKSSQAFAATPWLFRETCIPDRYLIVPKTSSENRQFVPLGFVENSVLSSSSLLIPDASLFHFGVLTSTMHNAWMRTVCGRLKSDYRYSAGIVYNNFPWPNPTDKQKQTIEDKAQAILNARAEYKTSTLADLYSEKIMPKTLLKAHADLDKAVDAAYGYKGGKDDAARVAFLFERYQQLTAPVMDAEPLKKARKTTKKMADKN